MYIPSFNWYRIFYQQYLGKFNLRVSTADCTPKWWQSLGFVESLLRWEFKFRNCVRWRLKKDDVYGKIWTTWWWLSLDFFDCLPSCWGNLVNVIVTLFQEWVPHGFCYPKVFNKTQPCSRINHKDLRSANMDDYRIPSNRPKGTSNGKQHEFAQEVPQIVFVQQSWRVDVGLDGMSNMTILASNSVILNFHDSDLLWWWTQPHGGAGSPQKKQERRP